MLRRAWTGTGGGLRELRVQLDLVDSRDRLGLRREPFEVRDGRRISHSPLLVGLVSQIRRLTFRAAQINWYARLRRALWRSTPEACVPFSDQFNIQTRY